MAKKKTSTRKTTKKTKKTAKKTGGSTGKSSAGRSVQKTGKGVKKATASATKKTVTRKKSAGPSKAASSVPGPILTHQMIAERAYYLYQASGCIPGRDQENWALAEQQLRQELGLA